MFIIKISHKYLYINVNIKNFTALNNESDPLKIEIVGETYCDKNFKIERSSSDLNALEFIIDGKGVESYFNLDKLCESMNYLKNYMSDIAY